MSSEKKSPDKREKLYLTGDPLKGAKIFKEHCAGCHGINKNMKHEFGPNLYGLWGREASTVPGFHFKEYDKKKGIIWDDETLLYYFSKVHIPGTKMRFRDFDGKDQDKADLIAYLRDATAPEKPN